MIEDYLVNNIVDDQNDTLEDASIICDNDQVQVNFDLEVLSKAIQECCAPSSSSNSKYSSNEQDFFRSSQAFVKSYRSPSTSNADSMIAIADPDEIIAAYNRLQNFLKKIQYEIERSAESSNLRGIMEVFDAISSTVNEAENCFPFLRSEDRPDHLRSIEGLSIPTIIDQLRRGSQDVVFRAAEKLLSLEISKQESSTIGYSFGDIARLGGLELLIQAYIRSSSSSDLSFSLAQLIAILIEYEDNSVLLGNQANTIFESLIVLNMGCSLPVIPPSPFSLEEIRIIVGNAILKLSIITAKDYPNIGSIDGLLGRSGALSPRESTMHFVFTEKSRRRSMSGGCSSTSASVACFVIDSLLNLIADFGRMSSNEFSATITPAVEESDSKEPRVEGSFDASNIAEAIDSVRVMPFMVDRALVYCSSAIFIVSQLSCQQNIVSSKAFAILVEWLRNGAVLLGYFTDIIDRDLQNVMKDLRNVLEFVNFTAMSLLNILKASQKTSSAEAWLENRFKECHLLDAVTQFSIQVISCKSLFSKLLSCSFQTSVQSPPFLSQLPHQIVQNICEILMILSQNSSRVELSKLFVPAIFCQLVTFLVNILTDESAASLMSSHSNDGQSYGSFSSDNILKDSSSSKPSGTTSFLKKRFLSLSRVPSFGNSSPPSHSDQEKNGKVNYVFHSSKEYSAVTNQYFSRVSHNIPSLLNKEKNSDEILCFSLECCFLGIALHLQEVDVNELKSDNINESSSPTAKFYAAMSDHGFKEAIITVLSKFPRNSARLSALWLIRIVSEFHDNCQQILTQELLDSLLLIIDQDDFSRPSDASIDIPQFSRNCSNESFTMGSPTSSTSYMNNIDTNGLTGSFSSLSNSFANNCSLQFNNGECKSNHSIQSLTSVLPSLYDKGEKVLEGCEEVPDNVKESLLERISVLSTLSNFASISLYTSQFIYSPRVLQWAAVCADTRDDFVSYEALKLMRSLSHLIARDPSQFVRSLCLDVFFEALERKNNDCQMEAVKGIIILASDSEYGETVVHKLIGQPLQIILGMFLEPKNSRELRESCEEIFKTIGFGKGVKDIELCGFDVGVLLEWHSMRRSLSVQTSFGERIDEWITETFCNDKSMNDNGGFVVDRDFGVELNNALSIARAQGVSNSLISHRSSSPDPIKPGRPRGFRDGFRRLFPFYNVKSDENSFASSPSTPSLGSSFPGTATPTMSMQRQEINQATTPTVSSSQPSCGIVNIHRNSHSNADTSNIRRIPHSIWLERPPDNLVSLLDMLYPSRIFQLYVLDLISLGMINFESQLLAGLPMPSSSSTKYLQGPYILPTPLPIRSFVFPSFCYFTFSRMGRVVNRIIDEEKSNGLYSLCFRDSEFHGDFHQSLLETLRNCSQISSLCFSGVNTKVESQPLFGSLIGSLPSTIRFVAFRGCLSLESIQSMVILLKKNNACFVAPIGPDIESSVIRSILENSENEMNSASNLALNISPSILKVALLRNRPLKGLIGLAITHCVIEQKELQYLVDLLISVDYVEKDVSEKSVNTPVSPHDSRSTSSSSPSSTSSPKSLSSVSTPTTSSGSVKRNTFVSSTSSKLFGHVFDCGSTLRDSLLSSLSSPTFRCPLRNVRGLRYLDLSYNRLTEMACTEILVASCKGPLEGLELAGNNLGRGHSFFEVFSKLFSGSNVWKPPLRHLGLSHNNISARNFTSILDTLKLNCSLTSLDISGNELSGTSGAVQSIRDFLRSNKCVRILNLSHNKLAVDFVKSINMGLLENDVILMLPLHNNALSTADNQHREAILEKLARNRSLYYENSQNYGQESLSVALSQETLDLSTSSSSVPQSVTVSASISSSSISNNDVDGNNSSSNISSSGFNLSLQHPSSPRDDRSVCMLPMATASVSQLPLSHQASDLDMPIAVPVDSKSSSGLTKQTLHVLFSAPLAWRDRGYEMHPLELLDYKHEKETLIQAFREVHRDVTLSFDFATADSLRTALSFGCRTLHFSGHGHPQFLNFEDGRSGLHLLTLDALRRLLRAGGLKLDFVFVSACFSRPTGEAFVEAGVPHVVCCKVDAMLMDSAATTFTRAFYLSLLLGNTVQESFDIAREAVKTSPNIPESVSEMEKFILLPEDKSHDTSIFQAMPLTQWSPSSHVITRGSNARSWTSRDCFGVSISKRKMDQDKLSLKDYCHIDSSISSYLFATSIPLTPIDYEGREVDMNKVIATLSLRRLVSVVGDNGVGKSALAAAVCNYIAERGMMEEGIIFIKARNIRRYFTFLCALHLALNQNLAMPSNFVSTLTGPSSSANATAAASTTSISSPSLSTPSVTSSTTLSPSNTNTTTDSIGSSSDSFRAFSGIGIPPRIAISHSLSQSQIYTKARSSSEERIPQLSSFIKNSLMERLENEMYQMEDQIIAALSKLRVLLVIDNIDALTKESSKVVTEVGVFFSRLFERCEFVKVLATATDTLENLGIVGLGVAEHPISLGPLNLRSSLRLFAKLSPALVTTSSKLQFVNRLILPNQGRLTFRSPELLPVSSRIFECLGNGHPAQIVKLASQSTQDTVDNLLGLLQSDDQEDFMAPFDD